MNLALTCRLRAIHLYPVRLNCLPGEGLFRRHKLAACITGTVGPSHQPSSWLIGCFDAIDSLAPGHRLPYNPDIFLERAG
jgi:hypothetical protein